MHPQAARPAGRSQRHSHNNTASPNHPPPVTNRRHPHARLLKPRPRTSSAFLKRASAAPPTPDTRTRRLAH
ncbi:hypothetical protein BVI1335_190065 [Burkholderia vietnamiensis]|nr:hypothetical protein BVI1335_190065 [Burkholderia vietnamiensis]